MPKQVKAEHTDTIGRPGEVGRTSHCKSCHDELVPPGRTECVRCKLLGEPYFGMANDRRRLEAD